MRGQFQEGHDWLERAIARGDRVEPVTRAAAYLRLASVANISGAFDIAEFMRTRGVREVRKICVDERWSPGAFQAPPGNFYRMEMHGGTARLYTEEFLERTAARTPEEIRQIIRRDMPIC